MVIVYDSVDIETPSYTMKAPYVSGRIRLADMGAHRILLDTYSGNIVYLWRFQVMVWPELKLSAMHV